METIGWTVRAMQAPRIMRHCKTCGAVRAFVSSGLFRVNANHHTLDIWLVHRCEKCGRTWNLEIMARVRPRDVPPAMLRGFQENDAALAERYAHDGALLARMGAVADYAQVPLEIAGRAVTLEDPATLVLAAEHAYVIRVSRVMRQKLGLSSAQFGALACAGVTRCDGADIRRARFVPGMQVRIEPGKGSACGLTPGPSF